VWFGILWLPAVLLSLQVLPESSGCLAAVFPFYQVYVTQFSAAWLRLLGAENTKPARFKVEKCLRSFPNECINNYTILSL
jgi:hypothetical protein